MGVKFPSWVGGKNPTTIAKIDANIPSVEITQIPSIPKGTLKGRVTEGSL